MVIRLGLNPGRTFVLFFRSYHSRAIEAPNPPKGPHLSFGGRVCMQRIFQKDAQT